MSEPENESDLVREQFKKIAETFDSLALPEGEPVMCRMHDAFGCIDVQDVMDHNCLGCNFADSICLIRNFLKTWESQDTIQYAYMTYILLCYTLVERIDTLFNIVQLNAEYRNEHFKVLFEIRRWANFIKHPKAFILTHHPVFTYNGASHNGPLLQNAKLKIDRSFVDEYYSNDEKNKALFKVLENREDVLVVFPDALRMTHDLCVAMCGAVDVICKNEVYKSVLKDKTTFRNYYWISSMDA